MASYSNFSCCHSCRALCDPDTDDTDDISCMGCKNRYCSDCHYAIATNSLHKCNCTCGYKQMEFKFLDDARGNINKCILRGDSCDMHKDIGGGSDECANKCQNDMYNVDDHEIYRLNECSNCTTDYDSLVITKDEFCDFVSKHMENFNVWYDRAKRHKHQMLLKNEKNNASQMCD